MNLALTIELCEIIKHSYSMAVGWVVVTRREAFSTGGVGVPGRALKRKLISN